MHHVISLLKHHGHEHRVIGGKIHAIHPHHGHAIPVHTARKLAAFLTEHHGHEEAKVHGARSRHRLSRGGAHH